MVTERKLFRMLVDAHCHPDEIKEYIPGTDVVPIPCGHSPVANRKIAAWARSWKLPFALGIAPQTAQKEDLSQLESWVSEIRAASPNAIGEIGLDFHWAKTDEQKGKQHRVFDRMLELAEGMALPVVLHCREAGDELLRILEAHMAHSASLKANGAMWHFFSGNEDQARRALDMGICLSFPPLPSAARKKALAFAPMDRILVETDAPVGGHRPGDVADAVAYVAKIKGIAVETVARQTAINAARLFRFRLPQG